MLQGKGNAYDGDGKEKAEDCMGEGYPYSSDDNPDNVHNRRETAG